MPQPAASASGDVPERYYVDTRGWPNIDICLPRIPGRAVSRRLGCCVAYQRQGWPRRVGCNPRRDCAFWSSAHTSSLVSNTANIQLGGVVERGSAHKNAGVPNAQDSLCGDWAGASARQASSGVIDHFHKRRHTDGRTCRCNSTKKSVEALVASPPFGIDGYDPLSCRGPGRICRQVKRTAHENNCLAVSLW